MIKVYDAFGNLIGVFKEQPSYGCWVALAIIAAPIFCCQILAFFGIGTVSLIENFIDRRITTPDEQKLISQIQSGDLPIEMKVRMFECAPLDDCESGYLLFSVTNKMVAPFVITEAYYKGFSVIPPCRYNPDSTMDPEETVEIYCSLEEFYYLGSYENLEKYTEVCLRLTFPTLYANKSSNENITAAICEEIAK